MDSTNDILERPPCLPSQEEVAAASPDARAILYAETLVRAEALGETVDPGRVRAACGVDDTLPQVKHAPRLLKEAPEFATQVKAGHAKLPKRGADWYYFWKRREKEAAAAATAEPSDTETKPTSPIEDVLEKVSEPEPTETEGSEPSTALVVPGAGEDESEIVLARLEKVRGLLAEIATVPQAKEAVAAAKAVELYAKETKASAAILALAFRVRSLAKRRLGETIVKMQKTGELEGKGGNRKSKSTPSTLKLRDLDISKDESARAKAFASVSEPEFERMLDESGSEELSDKALLRRIRATKAKTVPSSNSKTPSTATVPGQSAGAVTLKTHVTRVADALDKLLAGWKLTDLAPLKEAARGNERLAGGLERLERNLDRAVKTLRGYRSIAS